MSSRCGGLYRLFPKPCAQCHSACAQKVERSEHWPFANDTLLLEVSTGTTGDQRTHTLPNLKSLASHQQ